MRNHILCIILILMVAVTPLAAKSASQAGSIPLTPEPVPVETGCNVAAAYMPFWGIRPYQSWGDIDRHASYYPFLGAYTSDDPYIYDWHVYWARSAGIDTFMFDMGWFSPNSDITDAIEDVLNQSMYADDMHFTFNYFTSLAWWAKHDNPSINATEYVLNDFEILAERFLWRDNLLHINGVPVIYMASDWDYNDPILANIVEGIREVFRSHLATDVMILIDYVWPGGSTQISDTGVFDGVYKLGELGFVWEHYGWGDMHSNYSEMWHYNNLTCYEYSSADLPGDMVFAPCIMPGFNNTLLYESGQNENLLLVDRDADLYESGISQLVDYVDPSLNMLYLHTWNDLQEGTSIEPAVEYGLDFVEAVYSGLTDSASIPAFYTPEF
ncbi:MAG: glycoside hydrolase family 99-like domain-containing protein [Promethearchaeia archaeon]